MITEHSFVLISSNPTPSLAVTLEHKGCSLSCCTVLEIDQHQKQIQQSDIILVDNINLHPERVARLFLPLLRSGHIIYFNNQEHAEVLKKSMKQQQKKIDITIVTPCDQPTTQCVFHNPHHAIEVRAYPSFNLYRFLDALNPLVPIFYRQSRQPTSLALCLNRQTVFKETRV